MCNQFYSLKLFTSELPSASVIVICALPQLKIRAKNAALDPVHTRKINLRREEMFQCLSSLLNDRRGYVHNLRKFKIENKKFQAPTGFKPVTSSCDTGAALGPTAEYVWKPQVHLCHSEVYNGYWDSVFVHGVNNDVTNS